MFVEARVWVTKGACAPAWQGSAQWAVLLQSVLIGVAAYTLGDKEAGKATEKQRDARTGAVAGVQTVVGEGGFNSNS